MPNQSLQPAEESESGSKLDTPIYSVPSDPAASTTVGEESQASSRERTKRQTQPADRSVVSVQSSEATESVSLLDTLIARARRQKRQRQNAAGIYFLSFLAYQLYNLLHNSFRVHFPVYLPYLLLLLPISALVVEIVNRRRWAKSAAELANTDDLRAVGALAEAMDLPDKAVLAQAEAALIRLLPRLTAADASRLNPAERNALYRQLKIENALIRPDFMVVLLAALEKIGDAGALPAVESLAAILVSTPKGKRTKAAAQKCLPALRALVKTQETSGTLLRASSAEDVPGASLLRPARGGNTDTPEQLLRAATSKSDPA